MRSNAVGGGYCTFSLAWDGAVMMPLHSKNFGHGGLKKNTLKSPSDIPSLPPPPTPPPCKNKNKRETFCVTWEKFWTFLICSREDVLECRLCQRIIFFPHKTLNFKLKKKKVEIARDFRKKSR